MQSKAMVTHEGVVFWPPPVKLRSSCKIDITYFPFDDQKCRLKFGSWTYDGFQVNVINRSTSVDLANYVFNGEWQLLSIGVRRNEIVYACCVEPYPDVTFSIVIRRRTLYYLFNVIFPCLWLTVLSLVGFWLPPDSGEKITLGITVLLAFSVFMLMIAENMPATSEFVPLMGIYLTITMGMTSLSIVLTVFVLQLHHVSPRQRPAPAWLHCLMIRYVAPVLCMGTHVTDYYACARPCTCNAVAVRNRRSSKRDVCLVGAFGADFNRLQTGRRSTRYDHKTATTSDDASENDTRIPAPGGPDDPSVRGHLKIVVSKQEDASDGDHDEDDDYDVCSSIADEWKLIATIMDRLLFFLFLFISSASSLVILVFRPLMKPSIIE